MKNLITVIVLIYSTLSIAQNSYGTPSNDAIPEKLQNLKKEIIVKNFPKEIDPIKIKNSYYWKHNTLVYSKKSQVKIIEFGAYLFYNEK